MNIEALVPQNTDLSRVRQVAGNARNAQDGKLMKACQDFEAILVKQMLKAMDNTLEKNGLFDGGHAERIYEDMLLDEYSQKIAKTANLGVAETLYRQLSAQNT